MQIVEKLKPWQKTGVVMGYDIVVFFVSTLLSYSIRFGELLPSIYRMDGFWTTCFVIVLTQFVCFYTMGVYRAVWRFSSLPDLIRIIKGTLLATPCSVLAVFLLNRLEGIPRSSFIIDSLLVVMGLGGGRFAYRLISDYSRTRKSDLSSQSENALIIGVGAEGVSLLRDILSHPELGVRVVGFVDNSPGIVKKSILNVRILGRIKELPHLIQQNSVRKIFIALPNSTNQEIKNIIELTKDFGLDIKTLPRVSHVISGKVEFTQLRNIKPEDLLGRASVDLDLASVQGLIQDKIILVTGAGGSIGSELCKQICRFRPKALILFELTELFLFELENELNLLFPDVLSHSIIGDIRNKEQLERIFYDFSPEIVFHAAAYKHVPMMEKNPLEAVKTNIIGTRLLAQMAHQYKTKSFVMVSTDKAINPTNVMGTSKRIAEQICQEMNLKSNTQFMVVRFGNVLESSGSVIPIFKKQIEAGGPVTVTHPEIKRYFMSIPEATQLIIQSAALGQGGEVFVLEMGEPVKIVDLARNMIRLAGYAENEIEIKYIGLRPGEKLFEELFTDDEHSLPTPHNKIRIAKARAPQENLNNLIDYLTSFPPNTPTSSIKQTLKEIVPEYTHDTNVRESQFSQ